MYLPSVNKTLIVGSLLTVAADEIDEVTSSCVHRARINS